MKIQHLELLCSVFYISVVFLLKFILVKSVTLKNPTLSNLTLEKHFTKLINSKKINYVYIKNYKKYFFMLLMKIDNSKRSWLNCVLNFITFSGIKNPNPWFKEIWDQIIWAIEEFQNSLIILILHSFKFNIFWKYW